LRLILNMGTTKTELFDEKQIRTAQLARALGHPARVAILMHLGNRKDCICGDIVEELPLAQATVSQHLKELKIAGLIKGRITGVKTCYCINENGWNEAREIFGGFFKEYVPEIICC